MSATKWEPIQVEADVVRRAGVTPWRLAIWARREAQPERARRLLLAAATMIQAEAAALLIAPPPVSAGVGSKEQK